MDGKALCNEQNLEMIREEGIKPAVSVSAPTTDASDIQWIIGKLEMLMLIMIILSKTSIRYTQ